MAIKKSSSVTKKSTVKNSVKKTVSKKTTPKKITAKKLVSKERKLTKKTPVVAKGEYCFWTTDGQVLRDLHELAIAFGSMTDTVFIHHTKNGKNDFAEWVEHVLCETDCASDLRKCRKAATSKTVVRRYIRLYK